MNDTRPPITEAVRRLMEMQDEVVSARHLAPIVKMHPSVIIQYAKEGQWDQERLGKFVISGDRVKFFRKDFLQKCGFMDPEPEKPTAEQLLERIVQLLTDMNWLLAEITKDPPAEPTR